MTLLELCETSMHIVKLDVTVRNEKTELLNEYIICPDADMEKHSYRCPTDKMIFISKPLHVQQKGASSSQIGFISNSLPKALRDLEVTYWTAHRQYSSVKRVDDGSALELRCDVLSPAPLSHIVTSEPDDELDDQISFEEVV